MTRSVAVALDTPSSTRRGTPVPSGRAALDRVHAAGRDRHDGRPGGHRRDPDRHRRDPDRRRGANAVYMAAADITALTLITEGTGSTGSCCSRRATYEEPIYRMGGASP